MKPPSFMPAGCVICNKSAEIHHIKTRKTGGSDHWRNTVSLCREHHSMVHSKGNNYMTGEYPSYREALIERGWEYCSYMKRWSSNSPEISIH
jgi:5-methylcytosine-specific restriction endonuclease McrA